MEYTEIGIRKIANSNFTIRGTVHEYTRGLYNNVRHDDFSSTDYSDSQVAYSPTYLQ